MAHERVDISGVGDPRSLGALVSEASEDVSALIRSEVALAKAELKRDVANAAAGAGLMVGALFVVLLATIVLVISLGYVLVAVGLPAWAAFAILGGALLVLAGLLVLIGKSRFGKVRPPERTLRTTRETLAAVRPGR